MGNTQVTNMSAVYVDNAVNSQRGVLQDASNRQPAVRAAKKAGVQTRAQRAMADQVVKEPVNEGQNRSNRRATREEVDPTLASGLAEAIGNISIDDYESDDGIDEAVWNEPECAYLKEIMRHLKASEATKMASPSYMEHVQTDVTPQMRATLVDWLIYVHRKFKLLLPVLPLAINILDRFLSERPVSKDKLQLVGGVALLIASKFEEIYPPEIDDFVYASDYIFSKDDVIRMERTILNTLKFAISVPTTHCFLAHYLRVTDADETTCQLARLFCDTTLVDYGMLQYMPSMVAAASLRLAQLTSNTGSSWGNAIQRQAGFGERQLVPCMTDLHQCADKALSKKSSLNAVREKYNRPEYGNVSAMPLAALSVVQQLGR